MVSNDNCGTDVICDKHGIDRNERGAESTFCQTTTIEKKRKRKEIEREGERDKKTKRERKSGERLK